MTGRDRSAPVGPPSRLDLRDLVGEALAGLLQRPGRSVLTVLGTVIGIGAFVAVLGLTATASGRIGSRFDLTAATTVTVTDDPVTDGVPPGENPPSDFPADSDARAARIDGVTAAGVWWRVGPDALSISGAPGGGPDAGRGLAVFAATPGAVAAMRPVLTAGVTLDPFAERARLPVVLLSEAAAERLGVHRPDARPAVFIDGLPYTVIGVYRDVQRLPDTLLGMIVPSTTALDRFGNPGAGPERAARLIAATRTGAAPAVARRLAVALRPDAPQRLTVIAPPDPRARVGSDLTGPFPALAAICLVVGAAGIANTTTAAVLERTGEIGLRRSLGARPRHVAAQFLAESAALGTLGGLIGTALGVLTVVAVAAARQWTPVLEPWATLPAPLVGTAVGLLAGVHPAVRAARTDPLTALRDG